MKNNKGFTLVEVLAVIAILITVMVIVTPKVFKQFKTAENVTDKEQINTLINTAKLYMNQNSNLLPQENDLYVIQLQELKDSGLIKTNQILNPSTKEELNGCILVKYENNKYKYEYKEDNCGNQITVTFDPQGGTINQTTKTVLYNEPYGSLPTPTKEGYTFMGWNGKNLLNLEVPQSVPSDTNNGNTYKRKFEFNTYVNGLAYNNYFTNYFITQFSITQNTIAITTSSGYGIGFPLLLDKNNEYTLSYKAEIDQNTPITSMLFYENDGTLIDFERTNGTGDKVVTFTIPSNTEYTVACFALGVNKSNAVFSNIQLEEGDTATEYEPYYITSDTTVVQSNNHTLKAIWQANS